MACPACLLVDTDVLLQLFMANAQRILQAIRKDYGITATVVPEVELEVTNNSKFRRRFDAPFRKAQASGWLQVIEPSNYGTIIKSVADRRGAAVSASHAEIQKLGHKYNILVGRGEAYTHATAVSLSQPAASNDFNAIGVLERAGHLLPSPILRTFDLVVFAYQIGTLQEGDCDKLRQALTSQNEHIPKCWRNASFKNGLRSFVPRFLSSECQSVGRNASFGAANYATPITVAKV